MKKLLFCIALLFAAFAAQAQTTIEIVTVDGKNYKRTTTVTQAEVTVQQIESEINFRNLHIKQLEEMIAENKEMIAILEKELKALKEKKK